MNITEKLLSMQDIEYKNFHQKLMPTVAPDLVIGIRVPQLRKLAKELFKHENAAATEFIAALPHKYYEENNLHAFLVEQIKDYDEALAQTQSFLPYIDNWATCDMFTPKAFYKNTDKLIVKIGEWIKSGEPYTVRYAIKLLMSLYLDEKFDKSYPEMVANVRLEEYYVKMVIAWYFATALAKQYDAVIGYIAENRLDTWTHNKAIQKAIESRRISSEAKAYLRQLKRS